MYDLEDRPAKAQESYQEYEYPELFVFQKKPTPLFSDL